MRDLSKYPITSREMLTCLDQMIAELQVEDRLGDIRPVVLQLCKQTIEQQLNFVAEAMAQGIITDSDVEEALRMSGQMGGLT